MEPWIRKIGHPVLTIVEEPGQISVKQSRYLSAGNVKSEEDDTIWWIPLGLRGKVGVKEAVPIAFAEKESAIRGIDDLFYKLNVDYAGFYRTNYPPSRLAKLGSQLDRLSVPDRMGML